MAYFGIMRSGISVQKLISRSSIFSLLSSWKIKNNDVCLTTFGTCSVFYKSTVYKSSKFYSARGLISTFHPKVMIMNCITWEMPFTTTAVDFRKKRNGQETIKPIDDVEEIIDDRFLEDPAFEILRHDSNILGVFGSESVTIREVGVIVLQPWVKWGYNKRVDTSGQLMLEEAVALVSTLPGIHILDKEIVPVRSLDRKAIFGSGTLDRLVSKARSLKGVTCVFISIDMLKKSQMVELQEQFGMRILDRYSVVLGIFRHHALTKEAKLQVALAELPYIRKRISGDAERLMVMEREKRLKAALSKLAGIRAVIRRSRKKSSLPTVAVVGYTNSGKTSLIHSITGDSRAEGRNQLFATLDVTAHGGRLPCGLEVAFIDTVGFIQDIPTELIASFKATLEDAVYADVIVHIRDASHPDYDLQGATVSQTLASLPFPDNTPIITAANKIDLGLVKPKEAFGDVHLVSALTGQGLNELLLTIQTAVLRVTGRRSWKFTLPTGSYQIQ